MAARSAIHGPEHAQLASLPSAWKTGDVLAYRDAIREVDGETLRRELLQRLARSNHEDAEGACSRRLALLLLAAELETALEDAAHVARGRARAFTDACAWAWWTRRTLDVGRWQRELGASR